MRTNRFFSFLAVLLMVLTAHATSKVVTWDQSFIQNMVLSPWGLSHKTVEQDGIVMSLQDDAYGAHIIESDLTVGSGDNSLSITPKNSTDGCLVKVEIQTDGVFEPTGLFYLIAEQDEWTWNSSTHTLIWNGVSDVVTMATSSSGNSFGLRSITSITFTFEDPDNSHTHNYATEWSMDTQSHWHVCTSTEGDCYQPRIDKGLHSFDSVGPARYTCVQCGYVDVDKKTSFLDVNGDGVLDAADVTDLIDVIMNQ